MIKLLKPQKRLHNSMILFNLLTKKIEVFMSNFED